VAQVRRTKYLFFYFQDGSFIDIQSLIMGIVELAPVKQVLAISILKGEEYPISMEELQILLEIPSDNWISTTEIVDRFHRDLQMVDDLACKGLILSDEAKERLEELRRKDELLSSSQWNIYAALYHFMTKWQDMHLRINLPINMEELREDRAARGMVLQQYVDKHGKPPAHFHTVSDPLSCI
jgi:hypothetical protein